MIVEFAIALLSLAPSVSDAELCTAPSVAHVVPGQASCKEGSQVSSSSSCTPNCQGDGWPSYVPTHPSLLCSGGIFNPANYMCRLPAGKPDYVLNGAPSVLEVDVQWAAGPANDCVFQHWHVQARRLSAPTHDWDNVPGCLPTTMSRNERTSESNLKCRAVDRTEGARYEFRVREVCTDASMNGPWRLAAAQVTMKTVPNPEVLFKIPSEDVLFDPGQIMVAFSTACIRNTDGNLQLVVERSGDFCPSQTFTTCAPDIRTSAVTGPGIELAGERILLISVPNGFFDKGCSIKVRLDAGLLLTKLEPRKLTPGMWWNFTYIDQRPELSMFATMSRSTEGASLRIQWSQAANFNCTASPTNATICKQKAIWEIDSPTATQRCDPSHSDSSLRQLSKTAFVDFEITGLYPGVDYTVDCTGHKLLKWWVPIVPIPSAFFPMTFKTEENANIDVDTIDLQVFAVCADGRRDLRRTESMRQVDLGLGYNAQILDYKIFCIGGAELTPGQQARLEIKASTSAVSQHTTLTWVAGPTMDFVYTKPPAGQSAIRTQTFVFKICPVAVLTNPYLYPCQFYELVVRSVDVSFTFDKQQFKTRRAGSSDVQIYGQQEVEIGSFGQLPISSSDPAFIWSEVGMYLGTPQDGFQLPTTYQSGELHFKFIGQGTSMPLILAWRGSLFEIGILVSFAPPVIAVEPLEASLLAMHTLEVTLTHVPNSTQLALQTPPISTTAGYLTPGKFLQLVAMKSDRPMTENLCRGPTEFAANSEWWSARCVLAPAALTEVAVMVRIWDAAARVLQLANATARVGNVTFAPPNFTGMADEADQATGAGQAITANGPIDIGQVVNRSNATLLVLGEGLPDVGDLEMRGARHGGYHLELLGLGENLSLCSSISSISTESLRCTLGRCINMSVLPPSPAIRLYLGDLVASTTVTNALTLPRPQITEFGPSAINDAGTNRSLWFRGRFLGETECQPEHPDSVQLIGAPQGALIRIGSFGAPCHIRVQNSTAIECDVLDSLMEPFDADFQGEGLPPIKRSEIQKIDFSVAGRFQALNADEMAASTAGLPTLQVEVVLTGCPAGMRRVEATSNDCVPCPKGRWVTKESPQWPLRCEMCPNGKYQDREGSVECKACPANTETLGGADALTDCLCKPGFYSPSLNRSTGAAASGTACVACHAADLVEPPFPSEQCDTEVPVVDVCNVRALPTCVKPGGAGVFRICKAYCPGGTSWPQAKPTFWNVDSVQTGKKGDQGLFQYEPNMVRCDPPVACLGLNLCDKMYKGDRCNACVFGYWRDKATMLCMPCGNERAYSAIFMTGVSIAMVFGGVSFGVIYMRMQADSQFRQELCIILDTYVLSVMRKSAVMMILLGRQDKRKVVIVHSNDVGRHLCFAKDRDLGMVFRVDDRNTVHLAGLNSGSPMRGKVRAGWKLQTVNGQRLNLRTEDEIQTWLREATFPLRLTFAAPRQTKARDQTDDFGAKLDFADDRKMLIVMFGIMNSFQQISMFDFKWPPIFTTLAQLASQLSFNFNFFHPECSVEMPFIKKWLYFLSVPYVMLLPLISAYLIASMFTLCGKRGAALRTKRWLLLNAFARCCCMAIIMLLPFHLDQLLVPLACIEQGDGVSFVSAMPTTQCSLADPTYHLMLRIAAGGALLMLTFYNALLVCLYKSFTWQYGKSRVRDYIPFYVAMVEVSTFGQRGYVSEVRDQVLSNLCEVKSFQPGGARLERRELLTDAAEQLAGRGRTAVERQTGQPVAAAGGPESKSESVVERLNILQAKRRFTQHLRWPDVPDGNVITYGWVLLVNLFWRQLATLITIKITKGNLVVIGAGFQMIIFAGNITALICFRPYKSGNVVKTEGVLLTALFMLLWCAVLADLLTNHKDAEEFAAVIARVNAVIEALAVVLIGLVVVVPLYQLALAGTKFMDMFTGPDATLNELYMVQHRRKQREEKEAEMLTLRELMTRGKDEELAKSLATKLPLLDEAMARFKELGMDKDIEVQEQQILLTRLAKVVKRMDELKKKQREIQFAAVGEGGTAGA